jgi:hypothetical protein
MLLMATLTHSPDHCWAREENEEMAREWIDGMYDRADELGVDLRGAYVTPSEHAFYFVLEADDFESVTTFLGPPLLTDHEAHVAPVLSFEQAEEALLED